MNKCFRHLIGVDVFLMGSVALSSMLLSVAFVSATTTSVPATVRISSACSLSKTVDTPHEVTLSNGNYSGASGYGQTTLKAFCNDSGGFAIYAIGYTSDTYGNTTMHWNKASSASDNTNAIPTEVYDAGNMNNSSWSMKMSAVSGTYTATISTGFSSWHEIPDSYIKVAYRTSATDTEQNGSGTGSSITVTYDTYIAPTQPAGVYTGQVKFTLVHPSTEAAPISPLVPSACPANSVCYAPNSSDIEGDMSSLGATSDLTAASPKAGKVSVTANSTVNLIAPNFKRTGYGFAGWSTDFEATSSSIIYGPNENISTNPNDARGLDVSDGAVLYPVWIAKETNVTMQTFNSTNYSAYTSAPNGTVIALEDERDHDVYAVAKLADGKWWMIENLRLDNTATLTTTNTNNPLHDANNNNIVTLKTDYTNGTIEDHLAASNSGTWCTSNDVSCDNQTMLNTNNTRLSDSNLTAGYNTDNNSSKWYSYGNYYNWYSATAGNGTSGISSGNVDGDLCPNGWHLPYGGSDTGTGGGNTAGGFYYLNTQMSNDTSTQGSKDWRTYPNNFVYSGYWNSTQAYSRSNYGYYWSSSAVTRNSAYGLKLGSSVVRPGTDIEYKWNGHPVRCVAGS